MNRSITSCAARAWRIAAILGVAFCASGCLSFCHPVGSCWQHEEPAPLPRCSQGHVHIFFLTGLDPLDCANLRGVAEYCNNLGYNRTHVGQLWHASAFEAEIRDIHEYDADARFVLIGFSFGANSMQTIANNLCAAEIPIDLLVYISGNTLEDTPECRPDNVKKIVNILAAGCIWNGHWITGAENHHVGDVGHFGSPTHDVTLGMLEVELTAVAASIPSCELMPLPPPVEELPVTPRPVNPPKAAAPDEWDFLKPAGQLERLGW